MNAQIIKSQEGKDRVCNLIQKLQLDKAIEVTFKPYKPRRSLSQNSLLWKWHGQVAAELSAFTGHHWTAEAVHYRVFCPKFLGGEVVELPDGSKSWVSETSSNQGKMDLSDAMTAYQVWCIENDIELTNPE